MYDYLLVGCGLHNATFARLALDAGMRILIIDKRRHLGGNCYDERRAGGINVHLYGPHQFHTRSRPIWEFVNRFAEFNHYRAHVKARRQEGLYSMPPNMMLYHQLWGVTTPADARLCIADTRVPCAHPRNLRDMVLDAVGHEVYDKFYAGYSRKQWGVDPSEIPVGVGKRLPIRFNWCDRWFDDEFEGIPKHGYGAMIANMIDGADLELGVDYLPDRHDLDRRAGRVVFTGMIDEFFGHRLGALEYRTLDFVHEEHRGDYQGNAIINYTEAEIPFTRITEHKHFDFAKAGADTTIITKEYPSAYRPGSDQVPYYPVGNDWNRSLYQAYKSLAASTTVTFAGRLGSYQYNDMDTTIGQAMALARRHHLIPAPTAAEPFARL